ncbi:Response regulator transcription factor [Sphingomonas antarctica]|uniref:response regulator transcription factor n=1 Tax=Sphingomonas antarctica TaxID=2040274 RepID=UPI0039EA4A01
MRLLLIDDHPLFRQGFAAMIAEARPDWQCTPVGCGEDAEAAARRERFDIALIDLQLPGADGFQTLARIADAAPLLPCAIVSGREDAAARERARVAGAKGYIAKASEPAAMIARIEAIAAGGEGWDAGDGKAPVLTERQRQVLALLCEGHGNKEIRHRLGIAERTVRAHLTELFGALGAHSRVQAVLRARTLGLCD